MPLTWDQSKSICVPKIQRANFNCNDMSVISTRSWILSFYFEVEKNHGVSLEQNPFTKRCLDDCLCAICGWVHLYQLLKCPIFKLSLRLLLRIRFLKCYEISHNFNKLNVNVDESK